MPSRAQMRRLLRAVLRTDADLETFCIDYCPSVHERFSNGMERTIKLNILLQNEPVPILLEKLVAFRPEQCAQHEDLLGGHNGPDSVPDSPHQHEPSGSISDSAAEPLSLPPPSSSGHGALVAARPDRKWRYRWPVWLLSVLVQSSCIAWLWHRWNRSHTAPESVSASGGDRPSVVATVRSLKERAASAQVQIPGGILRLPNQPGRPYDRHEHRTIFAVPIKSFSADVMEVSVAAYQLCVDDRVCLAPYSTPLGADVGSQGLPAGLLCNGLDPAKATHPVNCVDHIQAATFCAWLGRRLPTQDEWLYAAGAQPDRSYPWGNDGPSSRHLNACGAECVSYGQDLGLKWRPLYPENDHWPTTAPVGSFDLDYSKFGVKDMAGNVSEWTQSCPGAPSCQGSETYIIVGGSWFSSDAEHPVLAPGYELPAGNRHHTVGFRCVR